MTREQMTYLVGVLIATLALAQFAVSFEFIRWGCVAVIIFIFGLLGIDALIERGKAASKHVSLPKMWMLFIPHISAAIALCMMLALGVFIAL